MYAIQIHTAYSLTHNYWMNQGEKYLAQRNLDKSVRNNYKCPLNLIRRFPHPHIPTFQARPGKRKKKDAVPIPVHECRRGPPVAGLEQTF